MSARRVAVVGGVVVIGVLIWLAAAGAHAIFEILVTGVVLVALIGGGNLLSSRQPASASSRGPTTSTEGGLTSGPEAAAGPESATGDEAGP